MQILNIRINQTAKDLSNQHRFWNYHKSKAEAVTFESLGTEKEGLPARMAIV